MPDLIAIDPKVPSPVGLAQAADILAGGGLVVFPTETLYGIAADINNAGALDRLAALKGRADKKPFPLILPYTSALDRLVSDIPAQAREFMDKHWPGALTLVLRAKPGLHPRLVSGEGKVGVRLSPHPVAGGLARALGGPITATSANLAGGDAPAKLAKLDKAIAQGVDVIIDAGPCVGGLPSTVVDCTTDPIKVLRQGAVDVAAEHAVIDSLLKKLTT